VGERPEGRARAGNGDEVTREGADGHRDDIDRIAGAVREVAGARAALISRAVDDEWLEVVAVDGGDSATLLGSRWRRVDLDRCLSTAEQLGTLHFTHGRAVAYVEVPRGDPSGVPGETGTLLVPLHSASGDLLGVVSTDGPVDVGALEPAACDQVELYAGQARLALQHLREHDLLAGQLRLADRADRLLHEAGQQPDVPAVLETIAVGVAEMMRAGAAWACVEIAAGVHAEAASHPPQAAERLGIDICTLVEPMVAVCWRDDTTLTQDDASLLGRLAALVDHRTALLGSIGSGTGMRGAVLVFRSEHDPAWTEHERDALRRLGVRLGSVVQHLEGRRRDRDLVDELRRLDQYRRDLVVSITHDLKTPLTAITLNAELLESDRRLADASGHPVAAIRRSAERLSGLVDDLLALARADEWMLDATRTDGDLVGAVHDALRHAETEAQQRGITFEVDVPEQLAAPVDVDALARVFVNLVANAVKFSLPDGRVRLTLRRLDDEVEFTCADDGIGIPEEELSTVFDMFSRSRDPRARGVPGNGMGLAISERILARLGGTIEVESVQGEGSTFTVRVPATGPAPDAV
jgi:signal transduction histidine kinase